MHIIKSFGNEDWEADPPLTRDMRAIFNEIMNMTIPESERNLFRSESRLDTLHTGCTGTIFKI